jgi:hypothetical protein
MPPIFKALTTIAAWVLFVYGWLGILGGLGCCMMKISGPCALLHPCIGVASLILSVVAMKLRQGMR